MLCVHVFDAFETAIEAVAGAAEEARSLEEIRDARSSARKRGLEGSVII